MHGKAAKNKEESGSEKGCEEKSSAKEDCEKKSSAEETCEKKSSAETRRSTEGHGFTEGRRWRRTARRHPLQMRSFGSARVGPVFEVQLESKDAKLGRPSARHTYELRRL